MAEDATVGTCAAVSEGQGASKDPGAAVGTRTAVGKEPGEAEETGGGRKTARPQPIRGPDLSGRRRHAEAEAECELEEDAMETRGGSKQGAAQGGNSRPDSTGDASSEKEDAVPDQKLGWRTRGPNNPDQGLPASGGEWSGSRVTPLNF
jgi:hypothetical protein